MNEAFRSAEIQVIVCAIGGEDLIRVLPYIDLNVLKSSPKPIFGYSDTTSLHLLLFSAGIVSYYGGSLMCQFALEGGMQSHTKHSIETALFTSKRDVKISASTHFLGEYRDWSLATDESKCMRPVLESSPAWRWHNCESRDDGLRQTSIVKGRLLGGCLSTLFTHFAARYYWPEPHELVGAIFFIEIFSETMPHAYTVYSFLQALGHIGVLEQIAALLVGRPKTRTFGVPALGGEENYRQTQREAVLRAVHEFAKDRVPVVFDLDIGHTDPQTIVPMGSFATIDLSQRTIAFDYSKTASCDI